METGVTWPRIREWLGNCWQHDGVPRTPAPQPGQLFTDSRKVPAGGWFVPLSGQNFEGHNFIADAIGKGAAGFFYSIANRDKVPAGLQGYGVAVSDCLKAYQLYASGWRKQHPNVTVFALTGSVGKTTTKEMLYSILQRQGSTLYTQASFNNEIGVPMTLLGLNSSHRYAVLEFGARMPGNIRELCQIAAPDIVGLLNVGVAHVGIFGSPEALCATKLEIFRDSPDSAVLVASADDPRIIGGAKCTGKRLLSFGSSADADVRLLGTGPAENQVQQLELRLGDQNLSLRLQSPSIAFARNAVAAAAMAAAGGVSARNIIDGLESFKGVPGRFHVYRSGHKVLVDDAYNANPDSMRAGFEALRKGFGQEKIVLVLGDMLELGDESPEMHRLVGRQAASEVCPIFLATVGPQGRYILEGAIASGHDKDKTQHFENVDALLGADFNPWERGMLLYVKASNGIGLSRYIKHIIATTGTFT